MLTLFSLLFLIPLTSANTFWITTELIRVDWREGCLTTSNCAHPRFEINEDLLSISDIRTASWPISEHFVQDSPRVLVSEWRGGKPEDVSLTCQVVGTDSLYGFQRTCDKTSSIRIFQSPDHDQTTRARRHQTTLEPVSEEDLGKRIIEIRGKCFNATLTIQKHTERCPSCPDPDDVTIIGQELSDDVSVFSASSILAPLSDDRMMHIGMLILAAIAVFSSAAFGCLLIVYLRQKKSSRQINVKPRFHLPYSPALVKTADDDCRYDMPWETQRNLGYWQTKSETTTTSPLDSSSSIGTRFNYRTTLPPPQTRLYHHISPNSSLGAHDSGLESV